MSKPHWSELKADEVERHFERNREKLPGKIVVASGASTSGRLHVGNARDVFTADAVARVLEGRGHDVELVWVSDDVDPLRRIPRDLETVLDEDVLGVPYKAIPLDGEPFSDVWASEFVEELESYGVDVRWVSSAELYTDRGFVRMVRRVLEDWKEGGVVEEVFSEFGLEMSRIYMPVCEECGRIATTEVVDVDGWKVVYKCEGRHEIGDAVLEGCGHEGELDLREPVEVNGFEVPPGKLGWKVEWPTRWAYLGVACEPFGKDHYVEGGSYDVGSVLVERLHDFPAPVPVPYEWITLDGRAMSSSKGYYVTLSDWAEVCHEEVLRYLMIKGKPLKHIDLDMRFGLLNAVDEYDALERRYFSGDASHREEVVYELSRVDGVPPECPPHVPFRFCAVVVQVVGAVEDLDEERFEAAVEIMKKAGHLDEDPEGFARRWLKTRLEKAAGWVRRYAPEDVRFQVREEPPELELSDEEIEFLEALLENLRGVDESDPGRLQKAVFEAARSVGMSPQEAFAVFYRVVIGKDRGPRAGTLISAVGVDRVSSLIEGCLKASRS